VSICPSFTGLYCIETAGYIKLYFGTEGGIPWLIPSKHNGTYLWNFYRTLDLAEEFRHGPSLLLSTVDYRQSLVYHTDRPPLCTMLCTWHSMWAGLFSSSIDPQLNGGALCEKSLWANLFWGIYADLTQVCRVFLRHSVNYDYLWQQVGPTVLTLFCLWAG